MSALGTALRYLVTATALNLVWEIAHLPLYTIWTEATRAEQAWAVIHCTAGDALIAASSLGLAVVLVGRRAWPRERYVLAAAATIAFGLAYTIFSEWLNVDVRGAWAYAPAMPRVPLLGAGLSPLAQWAVAPPLAFWLARRWTRAVHRERMEEPRSLS